MDDAQVFHSGSDTGSPPLFDEAALDGGMRSPARLAEIADCALLDPIPDPDFDSLTALGRELLEVPVCFVAVVAEDHDFYKSQQGFTGELAATRRLQGRTFCHYTLLLRRTLAIDDTEAASPWREVPTVRAMGVRAYLGVPILQQGEVVASLCAIDFRPHPWSALQIRTLRGLAQSLERELSLRRALVEAEEDALKTRQLVLRGEQEVAAIAHDMGTPITVINLALRRLRTHLQRTLPDGLTGPVGDLVQHLQSAAAGMQQLRTDFRAGALAGKPAADAAPERHALAARSLLRDVHRLQLPMAQRAGVQLVLGRVTPARVTVSYGQFLRVLNNVVGNALKFTPQGARVTLSCAERPGAEGPMVAFEVADQGVGMSADEVGRAFERGWQGRASLERGDGTGLGLAIVRTIVEDHGGTVTLASRGVGKGCVVTVQLPAEPMHARPAAGAAMASR